MSDQFLGEIRMTGFNFAPVGWALCNGQTLSISQNTALFALLGTTYGGNGTTTFQLPNMQSRSPMHQGTGLGLPTVVIGEETGTPTATLNIVNMPQHNHVATVTIPASSGAGTTGTPAPGVVPASSTARDKLYSSAAPDTTLGGSTGSNTSLAGGSQPFSIQSPVLVVNFIIAMVGIFPSRN